jgi:hypothetical protein
LDPQIEYSPAPLTTTNPLDTEGYRTSRAQASDAARPYAAMRVQQPRQTVEIAAVARPELAARPERFTGTWVREPADCQNRAGHDERIRIDSRAAELDGVRCEFRSVRQEAVGLWRVRALCTAPRDAWTANISLKMIGDNLRWSSERGTETYLRCSEIVMPVRKAGAARP